MSSRGTTAAALVLCAACGGGTTDVRLELTDDGDCGAVFTQVQTISIESIADNGACRLAHECAFGVTVGSLADVEAALRDAGDVLLELDAGEAQVVVINGRPLNDCFPRVDMTNVPVMCASNELDQAEDGVLRLELECSGCAESMELCP